MAGSLGTLVIEMAANTARLSSDMGKAVGIVERGARSMDKVFKGLAAGALVTSLKEVVTHSIEFGDNLNKAALKAGVGAKAISELAYVAKQSDVDLGSLSTALKKMQVAISEAGSGSKEPVEALKALGLTIKDIRGLTPDKQFELLADRINSLVDPADRARAATMLFGKAGADLLPLFSQGAEGIRKAREEAQRMGASFTDAQLQKLADADDAIKRLKSSWEAFATALTAKVAPAITTALDLLSGKGLPRGGLTGDMAKDSILADYERQIKSLMSNPNLDTDKMLKIKQGMIEDIREKMRRIQDGGGRGGPGRFGPGTTPNGFTDDTTEKGDLSFIQVTARKSLVLDQYYKELESRTQTSTEKQIQNINQIEGALNVLWESGKITMQQYIDRMDEALGDSLDEIEVTAKTLGESFTKQFDKMSVYAEQAARNMQDALANFLFDPFKDGLDGMLKGFATAIRQMLAQAAAADIFAAFTGSKGGNLAGIFKGASKLFGGFMAGGGPVSGGTSYVVGERGPELFTPGSSGMITRNGGGGPTINLTINAPNSTKDSVQMLPQIAQSIIERAVTLARTSIKNDISRGELRT